MCSLRTVYIISLEPKTCHKIKHYGTLYDRLTAAKILVVGGDGLAAEVRPDLT